MRHQWRLLLNRSYRRSILHYPSPTVHFQVASISHPPLSSFLRVRIGDGTLELTERSVMLQPPLTGSFSLAKSVSRSFSSKPVVDEKPIDADAAAATVIDIFTRLSDKNEIRKELNSRGIVISHDLGLKVLKGLESNHETADRFFQWVLGVDARKLSSKSYNLMLSILGSNGFVEEFWGLVDTMKKKGYSVSANVRDKVSEKFQKDDLKGDLERLKELFASGSMDNSMEKVCHRVCKIVLKEEWNGDVEKRLRDLKVKFHSDLVKMVVEKLDVEPRKALLFFKWVDEFVHFKHDEKTYNAIARVLGREKFYDRFRNIIKEMRNAGYEMEMETYVRVSARLCQTGMIKEAVELFEFALIGTNSPTPHCCTLLLKRIVTAKKFDMVLFSKAVKAYSESGNRLTDSILNPILKSLRSVDRLDQSNEVMKAMKEEGNYIPSDDLTSIVALGRNRKGKKDESSEFENFMESTRENLEDKAMASLVEAHCDNGELEEASQCFNKMIGKEGISYSYVGYTFEKLILTYCNKNRARDAYKLFIANVKQNKLKPWYSSYKIMVRNLLIKKIGGDGGFEEALSLIPMMKNEGLIPFVDPFMDYLSNSGTSSEAFAFLKAMNSKKFASITMVLRVFEALLKAGKIDKANELLGRCPNYIRGHADVVKLFKYMKSDECNVEKPLEV